MSALNTGSVRGCLLVALLVLMCALPPDVGATQATWSGRYVVQPGDSLTTIAKRYELSMTALAKANGLDWHRTLEAGVVLHVPATGVERSVWSATYVVRPGDTLSGVALHFGVSLSTLASTNHLDPAGVLLAGARLRVPNAAAFGSLLDAVSEQDPYERGATGSDVSYPGCTAVLPDGRAFDVIGINGGRPFTSNPCFDAEWSTGQRPRSVYVNTAYDDVLERHVTPDCRAAALSLRITARAQRGYAVGCSEAVFALELLAGYVPATLWLDVEPDNTWSTRHVVNRATLTGFLEHVLTALPGLRVGIYSNASFWQTIVGRWSLRAIPEWVSPSPIGAPGCAGSFAGVPVWLEQHIDGANDRDVGC